MSSAYKPARRQRPNFPVIPGQSYDLCRDIYEADKAGKTYGAYMAWKADREDREFFEKFGRHRRGLR
ncbi:MAG: hypothetical protein IJ071_10585 [Ruminococcus sp.]|nr:hypothetical protein [Ruminococcus sp.]